MYGPDQTAEGTGVHHKAIVIRTHCRHSQGCRGASAPRSERIPDHEFDAAVRQCEAAAVVDVDWSIPEWVCDVHTRRGKRIGRTRKQLLRDEHEALSRPTTIFSNFGEIVASDSYVQPKPPW
jgi:hypothetical protein